MFTLIKNYNRKNYEIPFLRIMAIVHRFAMIPYLS